MSTKAEVSPVSLIPSLPLPVNALITSDGISHCRTREFLSIANGATQKAQLVDLAP